MKFTVTSKLSFWKQKSTNLSYSIAAAAIDSLGNFLEKFRVSVLSGSVRPSHEKFSRRTRWSTTCPNISHFSSQFSQ